MSTTFVILLPPLFAGIAGFFVTSVRLHRLNLGASFLSLLLAIGAWRWVSADPRGLFGLGPLGGILLDIIAVVAVPAILASHGYWRSRAEDPLRMRRYYLWLNLFLASLYFVALSNNLGLAWLGIEGTTLTSGVLVAFSGDARSVEAAWKYVIICTVGLVLALFGITILYAAVPGGGAGLGTLDWNRLAEAASAARPAVLRLAFIFLAIGFGTKAGLAPMHTWLPDAHSEAPAPVSGLLSGVLLGEVLLTLVRSAHTVAFGTGIGFPEELLRGFGLFSVALATPFLLLQRDLKRLLAYSSLEQIGIMTIGFGIGNRVAVLGALLQFALHAFLKSSLFFSAGRVLEHYRTKSLLRIRGISRELPLTGTALWGGLAGITGLPPFGLFLSEFLIILGGFQARLRLDMAFLLFFLGLIFAGLWKYGNGLLLGEGPGRSAPPAPAATAASLFPLLLSTLAFPALAFLGPALALVGRLGVS